MIVCGCRTHGYRSVEEELLVRSVGSGADSAHNLLELGEVRVSKEQTEPGKSSEYAIVVRSLRSKVAWYTNTSSDRSPLPSINDPGMRRLNAEHVDLSKPLLKRMSDLQGSYKIPRQTRASNAPVSAFVLTFEENPLAEFVELPEEALEGGLWYSNVLCGVLRGALEMVSLLS